MWGGWVLVLMRFGLLAVMTSGFFANVVMLFPITPQLSAWYSWIGLMGLVLLLGLTVYAFHTSLGGRPMLQSRLLED
jgi:uncharacterized membrane protein